MGSFALYEEGSTVAVWPAGEPFPVECDGGEAKFEIETYGPARLIATIRGLAVEKAEQGVRVHGVRSLQKLRSAGYEYEGTVSLGGSKRSAFTTTQLFAVEGKLVDVSVLYVRANAP